MARALLVAICAASALLGAAASPAPELAGPTSAAPLRTTPAPPRFAAPIDGTLVVLRPFEPPPSPYAEGHRGVDLSTEPGQAVVAAADGTVLFAGAVAGRGVVVIEHPGGVRTEYEPVQATVRAGVVVARGEQIGRVGGAHGGCPANRCLHWGARRDGTYFDPMTLLRALGPVALLPWPD